jgi:hypothetical protein
MLSDQLPLTSLGGFGIGTGWQIQFFQHNLHRKILFVFQTFFTEKKW